jgi:hypothetical protein
MLIGQMPGPSGSDLCAIGQRQNLNEQIDKYLRLSGEGAPCDRDYSPALIIDYSPALEKSHNMKQGSRRRDHLLGLAPAGWVAAPDKRA